MSDTTDSPAASALDLEALAAAEAAMTPSPWRDMGGGDLRMPDGEIVCMNDADDAAGIVVLRNAAPELLRLAALWQAAQKASPVDVEAIEARAAALFAWAESPMPRCDLSAEAIEDIRRGARLADEVSVDARALLAAHRSLTARLAAAEAEVARLDKATGNAVEVLTRSNETLTAERDRLRAIVRDLRDVGTGTTLHEYMGICPNVEREGPSTAADRDADCAACDVLRRADAALAGVAQPDPRDAEIARLRALVEPVRAAAHLASKLREYADEVRALPTKTTWHAGVAEVLEKVAAALATIDGEEKPHV